MIEVLDCRELTEKEKRKQEIKQELEKKKRELEELESLLSEDNTEEVVVETKEVVVETKEDKEDTKCEVELPHGRARLQQKIGSLSTEEEKVVSEAIKKDNQKDVLSDEQLAAIKERSIKEYNSIIPDVRFSPKKTIIFIFIMCLIVIVCSIFSGQDNKNKEVLHDAIQNEEDIVIEVEIE